MTTSSHLRTRALLLALVAATTLLTAPAKAEQRLRAMGFVQQLLAPASSDTASIGC